MMAPKPFPVPPFSPKPLFSSQPFLFSFQRDKDSEATAAAPHPQAGYRMRRPPRCHDNTQEVVGGVCLFFLLEKEKTDIQVMCGVFTCCSAHVTYWLHYFYHKEAYMADQNVPSSVE